MAGLIPRAVAATIVVMSVAACEAVRAAEPTVAERAVVRVLAAAEGASGRPQVSVGTGVLLSADGAIVTRFHVVRPALQGAGGRLVVLSAGAAAALSKDVEAMTSPAAAAESLLDRGTPATIVWHDARVDLAVLAAKVEDSVPLPLATADQVQQGDRVHWVDFPGPSQLDGPASLTRIRVKEAVVAADVGVEPLGGVAAYLVTVADETNNSGGALVTECGTLAGIPAFGPLSLPMPGSPQASETFAVKADVLIPHLDGQYLPYTRASARCGSVAWLSTSLAARTVAVGFAATLIALVVMRWTAARSSIARVFTPRRRGAQPPVPSTPRITTAGRASITGTQGEYAGDTLTLEEDAVVIGTDPATCHLVFLGGSPAISPRHCQVAAAPDRGRVLLVDLGSVHGTFAPPGHRIEPGKPVTLLPGQRFTLGDDAVEFIVGTGK